MPGSQVSVSSLPPVETLDDEDMGVEMRTDDANEEVDELEGSTQANDEDVANVDDPPTVQESSPQTREAGPAQFDVQNASDPPIVSDDDEPDDPSSMLSQARATLSATPSTISKKSRFVHPEIIKTNTPGADITLRIDIERMKRVWSQERDAAAEPEEIVDRTDPIPAEAGLSNADDDERATTALARVIDKQDFDSMDVVGQFNLGFIIVRRRKSTGNQMDDLFIVDQHAADEKYNFEMLQETTKIESQKLFRCV
jgi:DNA mismatch repair protein PMS2